MAARYSGGYWPGRYGWWFFEGPGQGLMAVHDRVLFWVHDRFAVVADFVMRWDEKTHDGSAHQRPFVECNWQFCPGPVQVDEPERRAVTRHADGNVLMLFPLTPEGTRMRLYEGQTDPFRGWIGHPSRDHKYLPAPQLSLCADPMPDYYGQYVTVIVPFQGTQPPQVSARVTPLTSPDDTTPGTLVLTWGDGSTDEIWWTSLLSMALMACDDIQTDASLLHLQRDAAQRPIACHALDGTYCSPLIEGTLSRPGVLAWSSRP